jgi:hypothetical protein
LLNTKGFCFCNFRKFWKSAPLGCLRFRILQIPHE